MNKQPHPLQPADPLADPLPLNSIQSVQSTTAAVAGAPTSSSSAKNTRRVTVAVQAPDLISHAGTVSQLRSRTDVKVVRWKEDEPSPEVVVTVVDTLDDEGLRKLRVIQRGSSARSVLVIGELNEQGLLDAAECEIAGIVRRRDATPDRLANVIVAASNGEGYLPADLLGRLLEHVGRLQRHPLGQGQLLPTSLSPRETDVLRLLADGYDTSEVALKLTYSERTIKNITHGIFERLQSRNRTHAVAYALRQGLI